MADPINSSPRIMVRVASNSNHLTKHIRVTSVVVVEASSSRTAPEASTMTSQLLRAADVAADVETMDEVEEDTTTIRTVAMAIKEADTAAGEADEGATAVAGQETRTTKVDITREDTTREDIIKEDTTKVAVMVLRPAIMLAAAPAMAAMAVTSRTATMVRATAGTAGAATKAAREVVITIAAGDEVDVIDSRPGFMLLASLDWISFCSTL